MATGHSASKARPTIRRHQRAFGRVPALLRMLDCEEDVGPRRNVASHRAARARGCGGLKGRQFEGCGIGRGGITNADADADCRLQMTITNYAGGAPNDWDWDARGRLTILRAIGIDWRMTRSPDTDGPGRTRHRSFARRLNDCIATRSRLAAEARKEFRNASTGEGRELRASTFCCRCRSTSGRLPLRTALHAGSRPAGACRCRGRRPSAEARR